MASVLIVSRRIPILPHIVGWTSLGGGIGIMLGVFAFQIPSPFPKILFTFVATAFGVAMALSRWGLKWSPLRDIYNWNNSHRLIFGVIVKSGV